jgi:hypothetical protein
MIKIGSGYPGTMTAIRSFSEDPAIVSDRQSKNHTSFSCEKPVSRSMRNVIIIGIASGILFGLLDGMINANPVAVNLYAVFSPIARQSINIPAGMVIDVLFGFVLAGLFLLLYRSLPGSTGLKKGIAFAIIVWFLRVVMGAASQWMMFAIPETALLYTVVAGFFEMLILGIIYGATLKPESVIGSE